MNSEIKCPWCQDPKTEDVITYHDGVYYCGRCRNHYELKRHIEIKFTTRKIQYVKEDK